MLNVISAWTEGEHKIQILQPDCGNHTEPARNVEIFIPVWHLNADRVGYIVQTCGTICGTGPKSPLTIGLK